MNPAAARFLDRATELPTIPKVVSELIASFNRDDTGVDEIARLIGSDPVIAAKVMRLANSAFYRRPGSCGSVQDAVMYIGLNPIRTIVLGAGVMGTLRFPSHFPREMFWRYSVHTAVAARYFARLAKMDTDAAFTSGLIHAIGEPLIEGAPDADRTLFEGAAFFDAQQRHREAQQLGFCYTELSADLIERWHFPQMMIEAIRHQERPLDAGDFSREAAVIWLGSLCAMDHERGSADALEHPQLTMVLDKLGLHLDSLRDMPPLGELADGVGAVLH